MAAGDSVRQRPPGGDPVHAVVSVEAFVFCCENRVDHVRRNLVDRQLAAEAFLDARLAQRRAVAIEQGDALHGRTQKRRTGWARGANRS